jgi:hypothetical protein
MRYNWLIVLVSQDIFVGIELDSTQTLKLSPNSIMIREFNNYISLRESLLSILNPTKLEGLVSVVVCKGYSKKIIPSNIYIYFIWSLNYEN